MPERFEELSNELGFYFSEIEEIPAEPPEEVIIYE